MKWIACKDRMPKEYEAVIVVIPKSRNKIAFSWWAKVGPAGKEQVKWFFDTSDEFCPAEEIIYWTPMPKLPTSTQ
jgi:hypothetical protein